MVGQKVDLRYDYDHLGDSPDVLKEIKNGTHAVCNKLKSAKKPLIIVGADTIARSDGAAILSTVQSISKQLQAGKAEWKVLNVLHRVASQVNETIYRKRLVLQIEF